MIDEMPKVLFNAVKQHLIDSKAEFVDKSPQGGALYFFNENIANELKEKGYKPKFARKGSKSTGNKPAWYVKFK